MTFRVVKIFKAKDWDTILRVESSTRASIDNIHFVIIEIPHGKAMSTSTLIKLSIYYFTKAPCS